MKQNQIKSNSQQDSQIQAREMYEKGIRFSMIKRSNPNLKTAMQYFIKAADLGHVHASYIVGEALCKNKWECNIDAGKAVSYLSYSAKKNHPSAMVCFGEVHSKNGDLFYAIDEWILALTYGSQEAEPLILNAVNTFLGKDYLNQLFKKESLNNNDSLTQYFIGRCYLHGFCIEENVTRAIGWLRLSSKNGCAYASHALGYLYEKGSGVPKDDDMAIDLYKMSGEHGFSKGYLSLAEIYCKRNLRETNLIISKQNTKTAFHYFTKASELGDLEADNEMGVLHTQGFEYDFPNYYEAFNCFMSGADKGSPNSILNVANCYYSGLGVEKNRIKAETYFSILFNYGDDYSSEAWLGLGALYINHIDKKIRKVGRNYLKDASKAGLIKADEILKKYS